MGTTLSQKVWDRHVVHAAEGEPDVLYIDLHLVHEVQIDVENVGFLSLIHI